MNEKTETYLLHIKENIEKIEELITEIKQYEDYSSKEKENTRLAVERCLTIIGEAVIRIKKTEEKEILKNTKEIIGFRNLLIHAYDGVDDAMVWLILINHLPKLRTEIENIK